MQMDVQQIAKEIESHNGNLELLKKEVYKILIGQEELYSRILVALLTGGHILLEGVPGLAKTTAIKTMSQALHTSFRRIQFTPDLLPADLIGTQIYNPKEASFSIKKGPIFANVILADEINRAPAKVQSALLEAMQEKQVSIGEETFSLERPFLVMATQNPIEQEGTYPLPEAQVDRFMLKVQVGYPSREQERLIIDRFTAGQIEDVQPVLEVEQLFAMKELVHQIYIDDKVKDYVVSLVMATREPENFAKDALSDRKGLVLDCGSGSIPLKDLIEHGASPRASIFLTLAAKAIAFLDGRGYVTPQDIKTIAKDILGHRLLLSYEAEANEVDSRAIVDLLLKEVPVP